MLAARVEETPQPYAMSDERYDAIKRYLQSPAAKAMKQSDLERELRQHGHELMRQLLQNYLDTRGPGDAVGPVRDAEGSERTERRVQSRGLETVFGTVEVQRLGYAAEGRDSLHPLDAALNLPRELYSLEVRRQVAKEAARSSFDEVVQKMQEYTAAEVPKRQVEELVQRAAVDFDPFYQARHEEAGRLPSPGSVLVLTVDGKGVAMNKKDLREATRRAADKQRRKLFSRRTKGEKKNSKRMATVAAVYTIQPFVRTAEEFLSMLMRRDEDEVAKQRAQARPRPQAKRVWASLKKEPFEVVDEAVLEAEDRDPGHAKTWVALVDGAEAQLDLVDDISPLYDVPVTVILDIIHPAERVWKASLAFYKDDDPRRECWVWDRMKQILEGQASRAAAAMRSAATQRGLSAEKREPVDCCADYLLKYADYMHYDAYLAAGLPIASGVIEGACRHLVRDRMELTGARWRLAGAEAVLRLRALYASGDFDAYWAFHEAQEYERNHASRYAGHEAPPVTAPTPPSPRPRFRRVK
jgi:dsRNA-specific ribonuclease